MKISRTMVKYYLSYLTVGWFGDHGTPPETVEDVAPYARNIEALAGPAGDLVWLKWGLEYLLTTPNVSLTEFDGGQYPFRRDQLHDTLMLLWQFFEPNTRLDPSKAAMPVEWVDMSEEEWRTYLERLQSD